MCEICNPNDRYETVTTVLLNFIPASLCLRHSREWDAHARASSIFAELIAARDDVNIASAKLYGRDDAELEAELRRYVKRLHEMDQPVIEFARDWLEQKKAGHE